jgi:hypothetical protein
MVPSNLRCNESPLLHQLWPRNDNLNNFQQPWETHLFAGLSKHVDLRLVSRLEFGSGP